jgi:hypothetical protein
VVKIRREIPQIKQSFEPDLIHGNGVRFGDWFNLMTTNVFPAPLLVTLRGLWRRELDDLVVQTLKAANWVVGCSQIILDKSQFLSQSSTMDMD